MTEKYWIEDLRQKVTDLFSELGKANRLNEKGFIKAFMEKYPEDYNALVSEWEQKVINFKKKNRRGHPVTHPIRAEKVLSNMYRNYYYKLITKPKQQIQRKKYLQILACEIGNYGYRIKEDTEKYRIIRKSDSETIYDNLDYNALKEACKQLKQMVVADDEEWLKNISTRTFEWDWWIYLRIGLIRIRITIITFSYAFTWNVYHNINNILSG